jgi:AIPR protein
LDKITASLLADFSKENELTDNEDTRFEHLTSYLTVKRHYSRALDSAQLVTGSGGDTGLDGIAIIVNGALVTDVDMVQELLDQNGYLEVSFIFVQAERSSGFDAAKIGTMGFGVVDFFADRPKMPRNDKVKDAAAIAAAIYERRSSFRKRPSLWVYYVTTGKWTNDQNLAARRDAVIADLKAMEMFDDVGFVCFGAEDIMRLFTQTKNAISRKFKFEKKVEVPAVKGVDLALLGYIAATDFVELIKDDAGDDILGSIFYDNVRDWQDYNPVNKEIRDTLESEKKAQFVLMNNGVTIIAKNIKQVGSDFTVEDFQIVNGCQTSHVIFDQRDKLDPAVMVPLRLIGTKDEDVIQSIVLATNRQTELKPEQLYALTEFAKKLEHFLGTFGAEKMYYERRDGQYDRLTVEKKRIVTPQNLIKAFAAMFLNVPHASTKNYKSLRERVGKDIFAKEDQLEPYYVAALAAAKLEQQYASHKIDANYKSARYHILLTIRLLLDPYPSARMNSHEMRKRCEAMITRLLDVTEADKLFQEAKAVIDKVSGNNLARDNIRTEATTQAILKLLEKKE